MTRKAWVKRFLDGSESPHFAALCQSAVETGGNGPAWKQFTDLAKRFKAHPEIVAFNPPGSDSWWHHSLNYAIRWNDEASTWHVLYPADCHAQQISLKLLSFVLASLLDGTPKALSTIQLKAGRPRKAQAKNFRRDDKYRAYHRKYQLERYHRLKCKNAPPSSPAN